MVVDDDATKEKLHQACFQQRQLLEAPVTLVFAVDVEAWQQDMAPIIDQAQTVGAWPSSYCESARQAIPGGF